MKDYIIAKRDIDEVLKKETVDEIIDEMCKQAYNVKLFTYHNIDRFEGIYIQLPYVPNSKFKSMHPFIKLFWNTQQKANKIVLGDTNKEDYENGRQEALLFLIESLQEVFNGCKNEKLEDALKIYSVDDIKRIARDKKLTRRLCNHILSCVENKVRKFTQKKSNPDFYYDSHNDKYVNVYYKYLDADRMTSSLKNAFDDECEDYCSNDLNYENTLEGVIKDDSDCDDTLEGIIKNDLNYKKNKTGELTTYIFENFIDCLTEPQRKFVEVFLMYEKRKDGSIQDLDNNVLYTKQAANSMYKNIKKRLEKKFKDDEIIEFSSGRYKLNWRV